MVSSNEPQKNMFLQSAQLSEPTTQTQQDSILTQLTHHVRRLHFATTSPTNHVKQNLSFRIVCGATC